MPTYVYECQKCEKVIEVEQRISEDPLKDCDCGGKGTLKRLIQPTAVMFKGSGFHINDYSGSPTKSDGPKTETTTEAKSEAKTEPCGPSCACAPDTAKP